MDNFSVHARACAIGGGFYFLSCCGGCGAGGCAVVLQRPKAKIARPSTMTRELAHAATIVLALLFLFPHLSDASCQLTCISSVHPHFVPFVPLYLSSCFVVIPPPWLAGWIRCKHEVGDTETNTRIERTEL